MLPIWSRAGVAEKPLVVADTAFIVNVAGVRTAFPVELVTNNVVALANRLAVVLPIATLVFPIRVLTVELPTRISVVLITTLAPEANVVELATEVPTTNPVGV